MTTTIQTEKTYPCDEQLRQELLTLRDHASNEYSNSRIASQVGYSQAVISQYLNPVGNKYDGDTKKFESQVRQWLRDIRLQLDSSVETIDCEISRRISDAIEDIRTAKRIGVIIGAPGIGKSRGVDLYVQDHSLAIAFRVCSWHRNQRSVEDCLFKAADVGRLKRGENSMEILAEKLRGSTRPILVDDAHKASSPALQCLYDFRDATGMPVVLLGDDRLLAKLRNDPQRLRRTGIVTTLKIKNATPLIEHHVDALLPDRANGERKELLKLCDQIANSSGHFGSVQMELALAARIRKGDPDLSWCEAVKRAHKKLIRDTELT